MEEIAKPPEADSGGFARENLKQGFAIRWHIKPHADFLF
jgi:hypothetical protein